MLPRPWKSLPLAAGPWDIGWKERLMAGRLVVGWVAGPAWTAGTRSVAIVRTRPKRYVCVDICDSFWPTFPG